MCPGVTRYSMIQTSIDEGVEFDMLDKDLEVTSTSIKHSAATSGNVGVSAPYVANNYLTDTMSTSLDSNIEADLMSSISLCCGGNLPTSLTSPADLRSVTTTMTPPVASKFRHQPHYIPVSCATGWGPTILGVDRTRTHSPVSFREGRRASDGLMSQGVIAFRQRLKEGMKTRGVLELKKEVGLQILGVDNLHHEQQQMQNKHTKYKHGLQSDNKSKLLKQPSLDEGSKVELPTLYKRKSLSNPINLELSPQVNLVLKQSKEGEQNLDTSQTASCMNSDYGLSQAGCEDVIRGLPMSLMLAGDTIIPSLPPSQNTTNSHVVTNGSNSLPLQQLIHIRVQQKNHKLFGSACIQQLQQLQLESQDDGCIAVPLTLSSQNIEDGSSLLVSHSSINTRCVSSTHSPPQVPFVCNSGLENKTLLLQPSILELLHEEESENIVANQKPEVLLGKQYYSRTCMRPSQYTLHEEASLELEEEASIMDLS